MAAYHGFVSPGHYVELKTLYNIERNMCGCSPTQCLGKKYSLGTPMMEPPFL